MDPLPETPSSPEPAPAGPTSSAKLLLDCVALGLALLAAGLGWAALGHAPFAGAPQVAAAPPAPSLRPATVETPAPALIPASIPALIPALIHGRVLDAESGAPLKGASVWAGETEVRTDAEGGFTLGPLVLPASVIVKLPGYERRRLALEGAAPTIALSRQSIRAAYLTYYGVGDKGIRGRVLDLVGRTELNAVVIDVKGDRGLIPYRTEVQAAVEAGAKGPVMIKDFDALLASLKARGVYTIARVVAFKDNVLATHRPDLAIMDTRTDKLWLDSEGLAWLDPFREEAWDYVIAVAKEAALKGFDEIQFDYARFPTTGRLGTARYSQPNTSATRLPAISAFLAKARRELGPIGVFLAADLFGYTAFNPNDTDIGQRIEELSVHLDYLCPMLYPSGYHLGIPGYRNPVEHPYEIVRESVRLIRQRSQNSAAVVRPWLQDFRDYAFDKRHFGPREIRAQIKGAAEAGAMGWMLWNPRNEYTSEALRPKTTTVSAERSPD
jgi:hypothetical protein